METGNAENIPFIADGGSRHYQPCRHTLDGNDNASRLQRPHHRRLWQVLTIGLSFMSGLIAMALLVLVWHRHNPSPNRNLPVIHAGIDTKTGQPASWFNGDCGNTATEAKALDCRFDMVLHAWLPRDCVSGDDVEDEVLMYADRDWHWGLDNKTETSLETVRGGELAYVWTSFDWHVAHCAYVWKRLHRAMLAGDGKVDSYTTSYSHTKHCVEMVAGRDEMRKVAGTQVYAKFPTCA